MRLHIYHIKSGSLWKCGERPYFGKILRHTLQFVSTPVDSLH
jgi:hypothetical protein